MAKEQKTKDGEYPEGEVIYSEMFPRRGLESQMTKQHKKAMRLLMIHSRANGVYRVLADVIQGWTHQQLNEVNVAVRMYLKECREKGWRE